MTITNNKKTKKESIGTSSVTIGLPKPRNSSKGTTKRRIIKLIAVSKKGEVIYEWKPERPVFGICENENVGGILNEIFPILIMEIMVNLYMSRILIDGEISCEIMYAKIFEKLGLKREKFSPYEGYDIQVFKDAVTRP